MAELVIPGVSQQIRLIARLRWMLFKNALRSIKGRLEAVSSAILWLMMSGLVFGGGIFMGIASYYLVTQGRESWLIGLLWIVFLFWQLYPIFSASTGAQFDFSNLLRFPLRFGSFFTLSLVYGFFDPGAVASLVWLFAMWIGISFARPAMLGWGLIVLLAFAAMNLFFSRMVFVWIEKWLARRRTREILGFVFILFMISFQLIGPITQRYEHSHVHFQGGWMLSLLPFADALPPGLAGRALQFGLGRTLLHGAYLLVFLLVYAAAFLWLFRVRLAAQYHGENLSETSAVAAPAPVKIKSVRPPSAARAPSFSWKIPGLSQASAAVFEKEIRYAFRNPLMLLNLVIPLILVFIFGITPHKQGKGDDFFRHLPQMIFPFIAAYTLLFQVNWVFNSFAFEGTGIQFLLLSPVCFRDIFVGKNLFIGMLSLFETLVAWVAVSVIFASPPPLIVAATFAGLLYGTLANFALGNILSVCYPRRLEFGAMRQKRQAGVTVAVSLVFQALLIGVGALVFMMTQFLHRPALAILIFLVLAAIAAVAYRISLGHVDRIAMNHRETLTAELCRQE